MSFLEKQIESLDEARANYFELLHTFSQTEGIWKPSKDEWSAAEITEHLFWAELGISNHMWKQFSNMREGLMGPKNSSTNEGLSFDDILRLHEPYSVEAPKQTLPRIKGPLAFWMSVLGGLRSAYHRLELDITYDEAKCKAFTHQVFGELDYHQTLDFLAYHINRHKDQAQRLIERL